MSRAGKDRMTTFRWDLLAGIGALSQESNEVKGLDIKAELEARLDTTVRHGKLYPNLDTLARMGLVDKREIDGRTNGYSLTDRGQRELGARIEWLAEGVFAPKEAPV